MGKYSVLLHDNDILYTYVPDTGAGGARMSLTSSRYIYRSLFSQFGIKTVDSSISGLGGCPYARGASGNLATEDLVYFLYGLGLNTNIDLVKLIEAGRYISNFLGKPTESRANRALGDRFKSPKDIANIAACNV